LNKGHVLKEGWLEKPAAKRQPVLRRNWWICARRTATGLQRHGMHDTDEGCMDFYGFKRVKALGYTDDASVEQKILIGGNFPPMIGWTAGVYIALVEFLEI